MKEFFRTTIGKTLLFLLCEICGITVVLSVLGAVILVDGDFYTREEKMIREDVFVSMLTDKGQDLTWHMENDDQEETSGKEGNLTWQVLGADGKVKAGDDDTKKDWQYTFYYTSYKDEDSIWTYPISAEQKTNDTHMQYDTVKFDIDREFPWTDQYALANLGVHIAYVLRYAIYLIMAVAMVIGLLGFVTLMSVTGRRTGSSEIIPGPLYGIPTDLLLLIFGTAEILLLGMMSSMMTGSTVVNLFVLVIGIVLSGDLILGCCMSMAVRIKKKTLWKNTVICKAFGLMKRIWKSLRRMIQSFPMIWKVVLGACVISFLEFLGILAFSYDVGNLLLLWFLEKIILLPIIFYGARMSKKIQKGAAKLAEGDLSSQIDLTNMRGDFKKQGEDLNSIASGMSLAVEKQLKSERMKTELITNVSHDIKTPLTSIINYADLIGKEPCENKNITAYAEVLVRQSARLKRLIEDLVEASKASTGNLEVSLTPCDASVFLTQSGGEYEEKLQRAGLELVTVQPEEEIRILADGRRMWRVFDNLMNNICKYAQPGTRVYLTLERKDQMAVITFRNTSREKLNISEEELMERFVRGDRSRNTEGNGLGLSIARSLTELQKGTLRINIDGDLFKAILEFPVIL